MKKTNKMYVVLFIALTIIIFIFCSNIDTFYTREAIVIDKVNNEIYLQDKCGFVWLITDDKYSVGDRLKLTMNNNHTDSILDDSIKEINKIE